MNPLLSNCLEGPVIIRHDFQTYWSPSLQVLNIAMSTGDWNIRQTPPVFLLGNEVLVGTTADSAGDSPPFSPGYLHWKQ